MNFRITRLLQIAYPILLSVLLLGACKNDDNPPRGPINPQPQQYGTPFDKVPAIDDIQLYEVNTRVFSARGDLQGVTSRLDSIKKLGINVVWLMPIYQTGSERSVGSPYAIKDYFAIHSDYGDCDDLRQLVDKAHALDMAVILDWVANHTAWDHAWINNRSWYSQDANGNIIHPPGTNWQDVADLNFDNQEMREEMIRAMKYWTLEANVDGFRCDYAHGVPVDFWQAAIDTLRSIPNRELILFAESDDKALLAADFDMLFGWPFYGALKRSFDRGRSDGLVQTHAGEMAGLDHDQQFVRWTSNHDQHAWEATSQTVFKSERGSMAAFVIAACMGGVPMLYNGQEVAVPQQIPFFEGNNFTIDWSINPDIKAEYARLLNFRKQSETLRQGTMVSYSWEDVASFSRKTANEEVLVLANVRSDSSFFYPAGEIAFITWKDVFDGSEIEFTTSGMTLAPWEYRILRR